MNRVRAARLVKQILRQALVFLKKENFFVDVYLVNASEIKRFNKIFRGKNEATNVLAFPSARFPRPDTHLHYLGEIYLCPSYIRRQNENIYRLAIHGLLHLLGYTHYKKSDTIKMKRLEQKIVKSLNLKQILNHKSLK